jgi:hypothetical protein
VQVVIPGREFYRLMGEHFLYQLEQNFKRKAAQKLTAAFFIQPSQSFP